MARRKTEKIKTPENQLWVDGGGEKDNRRKIRIR